MGCDIPDIRLTVCIGQFPTNCSVINDFGQGCQRTHGNWLRCWEGVVATETRQPLWFCSGLARLVRSTLMLNISTNMYILWPGGRGDSKALGRVLLEQNVDRQTCQREAVNAIFSVQNPFSKWSFGPLLHISSFFLPEIYSSEVEVQNCSLDCQLKEQCVCSKCNCCTSCSNKCKCNFANIGTDASLAKQLLPGISTECLWVPRPSIAK